MQLGAIDQQACACQAMKCIRLHLQTGSHGKGLHGRFLCCSGVGVCGSNFDPKLHFQNFAGQVFSKELNKNKAKPKKNTNKKIINKNKP